jgi:hypothetical protein
VNNNAFNQVMAVDRLAPNAPTINVIATDDKINASEKAAGVVVSGTAESGSLVTIDWGGASQNMIVSEGTWSTRFASTNIPVDNALSVISVKVTDAAGYVSTTTTRSVMIDTVAPNAPTINLIAVDDKINVLEKAAGVIVSGTAESGSVVTITWGGASQNIAATGGSWSTSFASENIPVDNNSSVITVKSTDAIGNVSTEVSRLVSIDTKVPNAPARIWIPAMENGISSVEANEGINVVVGLNGTNAAVGDRIEIISTMADETTHTTYKILTTPDINTNYVLLKLEPSLTFSSTPNFRARVVDKADNVGAEKNTIINNMVGLGIGYFNNLSAMDVKNLTSGFLNGMLYVTGLIRGLSTSFFNNLDTTQFTRVDDDFFKFIPSTFFSPLTAEPGNVLNSGFISALAQKMLHDVNAMPFTIEQIQNFSSSNMTVFLNNWSASGNAMPLALLNAFSVDQIFAWSNAQLLQFVAESNRDKLGDDFIKALAKKTFNSAPPELCIPTTWLQKLTEYQVNLFLVYSQLAPLVNGERQIIPVSILNALTPTQVSQLREDMLAYFMPVGSLRNNVLNPSVIGALTPVQFSQLGLDAVEELGTNLKNNNYPYIFTADQIRALQGSDTLTEDTQLKRFFKSYAVSDPDTGIIIATTIPLNVANSFTREQGRQLDYLIVSNSLPNVSDASFTNLELLKGIGDRSYLANELFLSDAHFQSLSGEKLAAFFVGWESHVITGGVLSKLTATQFNHMGLDFVLRCDSAGFNASQLNGMNPSILPQLGLSWLNQIPAGVVGQLSFAFIAGLNKTTLAQLSSAWIKAISAEVMTLLDVSVIEEIIKLKTNLADTFTSAQVAQFTTAQLKSLFAASVSYQTGDGVFQDLSGLVSGLTKDKVNAVSLYLLQGAIQDSTIRNTLTHGRANLNHDLNVQIEKYLENIHHWEAYAENSILTSEYWSSEDTRTEWSNQINASIDEIKRLLSNSISSDWDIHLITETTWNFLSSKYNGASPDFHVDQTNLIDEIENSVISRMGSLDKSKVQGLNNDWLLVCADVLKTNFPAHSDLARKVAFMTDTQLLTFLSRFHSDIPVNGFVATRTNLSANVLSLLSPQQIINLPVALFSDASSNTWGVRINLDHLNQYSDVFLSVLGQREAEKGEHLLSATQVQALSPQKLTALLGYWMGGMSKKSVSPYVMRLFSPAQLNSLPDAVYQNLERSFTEDILDIIPPSKISLLPANYFAYPRRETVAGILWQTWMGDKLWPSSEQLANMTVEQANSLLSIWTQYEFSPSTSWSQFFSAIASLASPWTLVLNAAHRVATQPMIDNKLPSNNILEVTLAGLSDHVRSQLLIVAGSDGLLGFQYMDLAERSFDFIGNLPAGLIAGLNDNVINRIAAHDYAVYNGSTDEGVVFTRQAFSALTVSQITLYLQKWRNSVGELEALPMDLLNYFSPTQVAAISTDLISLSLTKENIPLLSTDFISGLSANQLAALNMEEIQALTIRQIMFVTPAVITQLGSKLNDLSQSQYNRLLPDQLAAIVDASLIRNPADYIYLDKNIFSGLSIAQLQSIPAEDFSKINADTLQYLSKAQVESLSYQQVWSLNNAQLSSLLNRSLRGAIPNLSTLTKLGLSTVQSNGLDSDIMNATLPRLERGSLAAVSALDLQKISPLVFSELSTTQLSYLTSIQVFSLRRAQYDSLSTEKQAIILNNATGPLILFSEQQVRALTREQISSLSAEIISDLSPVQMMALIRNENSGVLTQIQLSQVKSASWNSLAISDWNKLTDAQVSYIAPSILEELSSTIKEMLKSRMSHASSGRSLSDNNQISFSAAQLAALDKDVMNVSLPSFAQKTYLYTHPYYGLSLFHSVHDFRSIVNIADRSTHLSGALLKIKGLQFLSSLSLVYGATNSLYAVTHYDERRDYLDGLYIRNSLEWLAFFLQIPVSILFQARKEYQQQYSNYLSNPANTDKRPLTIARWALAHTNFAWLSHFGLDWLLQKMFAPRGNRVAPLNPPVLVQRGGNIIIGGRVDNPLETAAILYGIPSLSADMEAILNTDIDITLGSYSKFGILFTDTHNTKWITYVERIQSGGVSRIVRKYAQIPAGILASFTQYREYFSLTSVSTIRTRDGIMRPVGDGSVRVRRLMQAQRALVLGNWQEIKNNFVSSNFVYLFANSLMFFNSAHSLYSVTKTPDETMNRNFAYWVNVFEFLGSASLWSSSLINLLTLSGYARQKWVSGLNTLGWGLNYVAGLLQMTGNIVQDTSGYRTFQLAMLGLYNLVYLLPVNISLRAFTLSLYSYSFALFTNGTFELQNESRIAELKRIYSSQKRTVEIEILDILSLIQRSVTPGIEELFRTEQFNRIRSMLLDNQSEKLNSLFVQQETAKWIYQEDGLVKFNQLFNQLRGSIQSAIMSRSYPIGTTTFENLLGITSVVNNPAIVDGYNDFYLIHGDTYNTKDYYLTDEAHNKVEARLMNAHISTSSFENTRNFDEYRIDYTSNFFLGDNQAHKFLRTSVVNENRIVFADRGIGISYVQVLANDAFVNVNSSPIVLDATAATKEMFFDIQTDNVIVRTGRTNKSKFRLSVTNSLSDQEVSRQLQSILNTVRIFANKNETQEFLSELNIIGVSDTALNINLDRFENVLVNSEASNNDVTGTFDYQSYVGLSGRNRVNLSGKGAAATVKGYGNHVTLGGYKSNLTAILDYVALPGEYPANKGLDVGYYDGGYYDSETSLESDNFNTLNFALTQPLLNLLVNADNIGGHATIYDERQNIIDRANFTRFDSIIGSSLNNYVQIHGQSALKKLFLGNGENRVEVKNTENLNIEARGASTHISFKEESGVTRKANYVHATGNYVNIVSYANTIIGGVFEGANDIIDLSQHATSRFDVLEFGWGTHNLLLADNQISGQNVSIIKLLNLVEDSSNRISITNVSDTKTLRTAGNDILISLADSLDFNVNYDADGLHFESKSGLVKFNFDSLAFDRNQDSHVFLQENTNSLGTELTVDMAVLVDTIIHMQGGFTNKLQGSSSFNGYDLRAIFDVIRL